MPEMDDAARSRRRALAALAWLVPAPTLGIAVALGLAPGPVGSAVFACTKVWVIAFPALWWLRVERGRRSWSPPRQGGLAVGLATGIVITAVIAGAYALLGATLVDPTRLRALAAPTGLDTPAVYVAGAVYWITVNSVIEEYVFRWFVWRQCAQLLPRPGAIAATAAVFTLHHTVALWLQFDWRLAVVGSAGVFVGSVCWSVLYVRYRSIWPGWVSHACADVAIFAIGWRLLFG